jgi:hypothetical protein
MVAILSGRCGCLAGSTGTSHFPPKINWGRGRLAGYSSSSGFAAKFCRLNQIPPKQFREFWYASVESGYIGRKKEQIRHIARLLDEPLAVVGTVFGPTGMGWGHFSLGQRDSVWHGKLAYCPLCLAEGWHSHFHETRWLKQCPIHCVDLVTEALPDGSGAKVDHEIGKLILLLDAEAPGWFTANGQWRVKASVKKTRVFQNFIRWYHATQKMLPEWSSECLGIFGHHGLDSRFTGQYQWQHLDLLIGRLHWISPIPRQIDGIFAANPLYGQPDIRFYNKNVASEFRVLQAKFPPNELFYLYKLSQFVAGNLSAFQAAAETAIRLFESLHPPPQCRCAWGRHPNDGWRRFQPGTVQDFWAYNCPYDLAIMEMRSDWLGLLPVTLPERRQHIDYYKALAHAAGERGFVSVTKYAPEKLSQNYDHGKIPILKFHWSSEMARLVEMILVETAMPQMNELRQWLSAIEAGAKPNYRNNLPSNIYLVQHGDSDLQMVVWLAVGEKSD